MAAHQPVPKSAANLAIRLQALRITLIQVDLQAAIEFAGRWSEAGRWRHLLGPHNPAPPNPSPTPASQCLQSALVLAPRYPEHPVFAWLMQKPRFKALLNEFSLKQMKGVRSGQIVHCPALWVRGDKTTQACKQPACPSCMLAHPACLPILMQVYAAQRTPSQDDKLDRISKGLGAQTRAMLASLTGGQLPAEVGKSLQATATVLCEDRLPDDEVMRQRAARLGAWQAAARRGIAAAQRGDAWADVQQLDREEQTASEVDLDQLALVALSMEGEMWRCR